MTIARKLKKTKRTSFMPFTPILNLYTGLDPRLYMLGADREFAKIWNQLDSGGSGGGISDAPSDGTLYGRQNATWEPVTGITGPQGPAGPQGPTGPQGVPGPTAVSANAGNAATLGTDSLIFVAATTSIDGGTV
jgi:hypothetical protein